MTKTTDKAPPSYLDVAVRDAVQEAVCSALERHLPEQLSVWLGGRTAILECPKADQVNSADAPEKFVSMSDLCERLRLNRTTILRRERAGKIPKRRKFPDGRAGWTETDIKAWFAAAEHAEPDRAHNAMLASRIKHQPGH